MLALQGELSHLALATAVGAAFLIFGAMAIIGGRRTVETVRDLGFGGLAFALFIGVSAEGLSRSIAEATPYTAFFLSSGDLRAEALMEDADLRTRTNVDPRLRYIPTSGERVPNLESGYRLGGPLRTLDFPVLRHATPISTPGGVEPLAAEADPNVLRHEIAGLYEDSKAVAGEGASDEARGDLFQTASVGLLLMGAVGLIAGLLPLLFRVLALTWDTARLAFATRRVGYRGSRGRAIRMGSSGLARWHFASARPYASLATFGVLAMLGGIVTGFLREEETRRVAHVVFAEARHLRLK